MPEGYKPGQRKPVYGQNHQLSENRFAWVICEGGKYMILVGDDKGSGQDVVIFNPSPGRNRDLAINLTNLTTPELDAIEELFKTALAWARPVVERRDKEAQDAWDAGDDSHTRNYRGLPTVVYRKRPQSQHSQGVRSGPEGVPESSGGERLGNEGGVRGAGSELAEPDTREGCSEDNGSEDD